MTVQLRIGQKISGIKSLITGISVMGLGISFIPFINIPSLLILAILSNTIYIIGLLIVLNGTMEFMNIHKNKIIILLLVLLIYIIPYYIFMFYINIIWIRNLIVNITHMVIFVLFVITLLKGNKQHLKSSIVFTSIVFIIAGLFSLLRIILSLGKPLNINYKGLGLSLPLAFLIYGILSMFWVFGFILINTTQQTQDSTIPTNNIILTEREKEIIELLNQGLTNKQISEKCFISLNTVKTHIKNIYSKFGVNSRVNLLIQQKKLLKY